MSEPTLTRFDVAGAPRGVVLVLHGGRPTSTRPVDGRSASWRLMLALQRAVSGPARDRDVGVWGLRYRERGWNGGAGPQADARWALAEVARAHGPVPVVLLGHSMGARVSLHVADAPEVLGVVALAPWVAEGTPVGTLAGRHLVAAHGRRDRVTSYDATRAYVAAAASVAATARFVDMGALGHYLIRGRSAWFGVATRASLGLLTGGTEEISPKPE